MITRSRELPYLRVSVRLYKDLEISIAYSIHGLPRSMICKYDKAVIRVRRDRTWGGGGAQRGVRAEGLGQLKEMRASTERKKGPAVSSALAHRSPSCTHT
jgi:hypothetical protein